MKKIYIPFLILIILLTSACSTTKYVPENEYLLNNVFIESDTKIVPKDEIKTYIRQLPNNKIFGLIRLQQGIYDISGRDSTKWINRLLKKIGDEPVIYNQQLTSISENEIRKLFNNRGFINAEVKSEITHPKDKIADATYKINAKEPYKIHGYSINIQNPELLKIASDTTRSLVKLGNLFDSDMLNNERDRITNRFRNLGYYNFTRNQLHYYADSALNAHQVDLVLEVPIESNPNDSLSMKKLFQKYTINKVRFYSERDKTIENFGSKLSLDTLDLDNYEIVYENKRNIRPSVLVQSTHIVPDDNYNDRNLERTYSSLNTLTAVKYSDISFREVDKDKLDCYIRITPNKLQSFSTDVEGTYSSGYWGIGGNINYGHKNIFGGSESLNIRTRASYEYQKGQNAYEMGTDIGLKFPTFLLPFASREMKRNIRANTEINGSFSYRNRPSEFTGIVTGVGFKYTWSEQFNIKHNFDVLDVSYVYYPYISPDYKAYLQTSQYFQYNFQNHLIMRAGYSGSYTGFRQYQPLRNYTTMTYGVETAGNLLYGLSHLFNLSKDDNGAYKVFGIPYAQYLKGDYSISKYQIFDKNNRIVYHFGLGLAFPFGNANLIPFEKRYFSGGANSVRGWTSYQLGPGTFKSKTNRIDYNTQMGDIKIDMNMEYRSKLFWKFEGALFLDAGNVWTVKEYDTQPGGAFRFDTFLSQMGIAYGAGIRTDFSFFIFRVDLGLKLYDPTLTRTERWRTRLTKNDFAVNIAIGYPF